MTSTNGKENIEETRDDGAAIANGNGMAGASSSIPDRAEAESGRKGDATELLLSFGNGLSFSTEPINEMRDFRIALLGNVDVGKSTLVGVLSRGIRDDGRGYARSFILRHQHEQKRGQTSSVSLELLGFKDGEQVLPMSSGKNLTSKSHNKDFFEVASRSDYRVTLVDLCGHEKFLKTTIYGLTGMTPDCAMVIIGANNGIQRMTREHLGLCCALRVPVLVVVTKIDMCPENIFQDTQQRVKRVLRKAGRKTYYVRDRSDISGAISSMLSNQFAPVFEVSSVTGQGIEELREFIHTLSKRPDLKLNSDRTISQHLASEDEKAVVSTLNEESGSQDEVKADGLENEKLENDGQSEAGAKLFCLDEVYVVPGVGIVIGGTVKYGKLEVGDKLLVGPDRSGYYRPLVLRSIQRQCVPSKAAYTGQHATLAVKAVGGKRDALKRTMFRKGMVVVGEKELQVLKECTVFEFEAVVKILHHTTTISPGYSPVVHIGVVRQAAQILSIKTLRDGKDTVARTGSNVKVRFRFLHYAEFLSVGRPLVFREGRAKGCGKITQLFHVADDHIDVLS